MHCSVSGHSRDDVHRFRVSDDVPQALRIQQHRSELPRRRLCAPVGDADRRLAEAP